MTVGNVKGEFANYRGKVTKQTLKCFIFNTFISNNSIHFSVHKA